MLLIASGVVGLLAGDVAAAGIGLAFVGISVSLVAAWADRANQLAREGPLSRLERQVLYTGISISAVIWLGIVPIAAVSGATAPEWSLWAAVAIGALSGAVGQFVMFRRT